MKRRTRFFTYFIPVCNDYYWNAAGVFAAVETIENYNNKKTSLDSLIYRNDVKSDDFPFPRVNSE